MDPTDFQRDDANSCEKVLELKQGSSGPPESRKEPCHVAIAPQAPLSATIPTFLRYKHLPPYSSLCIELMCGGYFENADA
jgi:hypothetical protein